MYITLAQNAVFAGMAGMMVVFAIIALLASIFWVWMLVDVLTSNMESTDKILWFLVVFFLHLIGAIIYYVVKRPTSHTGHTGGRPAIT